MRGHRVDIRQSERFDHYPLMSGNGFADIHSYSMNGGGWGFGKLISAAKNLVPTAHAMIKSKAAGALDLAQGAAMHGLHTGVKSLLQTGNLNDALAAGAQAGKDKFMANIGSVMKGKGMGHSEVHSAAHSHSHRSRKRARPIY
tara:strand:- start:1171 stop:1599 length:429 start_codon:yes stop_codon:yes gene_type:complete